MPTAERYSRYREDQTTIWVSKTAAEFLSRDETALMLQTCREYFPVRYPHGLPRHSGRSPAGESPRRRGTRRDGWIFPYS